ncbi:hypothetical protein L3Y34_017832 [Caenorhabditis briggsae]|uniref:S-methyl-5'-thioadenosine phosphorylase n=1 Tax=Caenorhabditis briggsae TaxID=6238 RepID=A0AAE9DJP2_CAEBR|nr:hypothetical protein L3Y34_017832 [Caenorhabditis briggsae]
MEKNSDSHSDGKHSKLSFSLNFSFSTLRCFSSIFSKCVKKFDTSPFLCPGAISVSCTARSPPPNDLHFFSSCSFYRFSLWRLLCVNSSNMVKVGIIGGSGLEDPNILLNPTAISIDTPYGQPSDHLIQGTINGVECVLLARHGRKHDIMPGNVNYRANLWALYSLGVDVIIASTACGSLKEEVAPGHLLFPDSVFDRTNSRKATFFDGTFSGAPGVSHIQAHPTYNEKLRQVLISTAEKCKLVHHRTGFGVCIEGPRFSTKAESMVFKSWGASLVNMTMMPECILAKELGIPYATTALVTDYDCWKDEDQVTAASVMKVFAANVEKAKTLFIEAVAEIGKIDWSAEILQTKTAARQSIMISPDVEVEFLKVPKT